MRTQPLSRTASITLDGSGNGTCPQLGPALPGEVWTIETASVSTGQATVTKEAAAKIYDTIRGFIDGTTWGSTGDSTANFTGPYYPGQNVYATWAGGDAGAVATLTVRGTRQVP